MFGKNEKERREVASITKVMTCYVTLQMMEKFKKKDDHLIEISADAASVHGTSADLLEGDTLTIWQLLHGLMLPSGNDAAHCLAEYFGGLLKKEAQEIEEKERKERE
jgi:D-alanyl-D-alanine carboxypeptidase (penicillin-binding protein 5/6)